MADVKELIEELTKLKDKADKMSKNYFCEDRLIWIDLETMKDHIEIGIDRLTRDIERIQRQGRAA